MGTTTVAAGNGTSQQGGAGEDGVARAAAAAALAAANTKAPLQTGALAPSTTAAPNATAIINAIENAFEGAVAGGLIPTEYPSDNKLQLDLVGGREYGLIVMSANKVIDYAPGPVLNGNFNLTLQIDSGTLDHSAFSFQGDEPVAGGTYRITGVQGEPAFKPTMFSRLQEAVDGSPPSPTVPDAPTGLTLGTPTSSAQPLTWTAPSNNGGASILDYEIQHKLATDPDSAFVTFADGTSAGASATVTGLPSSSNRSYRTRAVNSVGPGAWSTPATGSTAASGGGGASLTRSLVSMPSSAVQTAVAGSNNWLWMSSVDVPLTWNSKDEPPLGAIVARESNMPIIYADAMAGFPGLTSDGSDSVGGNAFTANPNCRFGGGGTPGTPSDFEFDIPVSVATRVFDLYFVAGTDGADTVTITAVLADGSATMAPYVASQGHDGQRLRITCTAGSTTTLTVRIRNLNVVGDGSLAAGFLLGS